ncbi:hypothetical protein T492DRAFT_834126 [Pavlovales sp. CCMP2436]|nr:hypothetical protein T492DRAFT_834126 [Pavlovales sp. CCMP2436]
MRLAPDAWCPGGFISTCPEAVNAASLSAVVRALLGIPTADVDGSMLIIQHINSAAAFTERFADCAGTLSHLLATGAARTPNNKPAKSRSDGKPEIYGSRPFLGWRMLSASVGPERARLDAVLAQLLKAELLVPSLHRPVAT